MFGLRFFGCWIISERKRSFNLEVNHTEMLCRMYMLHVLKKLRKID